MGSEMCIRDRAKAELEANGVTLADYDSILDGMAAETEPQTVLAESATVNYAVYQVLEQNPALTVKDGTDPLLMMKGVKNETELAHPKQADIRDSVAMVRFQIELESRLAAGETLTELTVDEILHKYRSADDKFLVESFGTIAAYGGNAAMMHYHATPEDHAVLQRKGFLLVDSGATYLDGTTDITRTYPLGELTEDERLFYTWTLQCHIDIAKAVWLDYCDCHMLDTIAREPLWRHLINYRCGTGHSVSFVGNVHEGPHALNGRNLLPCSIFPNHSIDAARCKQNHIRVPEKDLLHIHFVAASLAGRFVNNCKVVRKQVNDLRMIAALCDHVQSLIAQAIKKVHFLHAVRKFKRARIDRFTICRKRLRCLCHAGQFTKLAVCIAHGFRSCRNMHKRDTRLFLKRIEILCNAALRLAHVDHNLCTACKQRFKVQFTLAAVKLAQLGKVVVFRSKVLFCRFIPCGSDTDKLIRAKRKQHNLRQRPGDRHMFDHGGEFHRAAHGIRKLPCCGQSLGRGLCTFRRRCFRRNGCFNRRLCCRRSSRGAAKGRCRHHGDKQIHKKFSHFILLFVTCYMESGMSRVSRTIMPSMRFAGRKYGNSGMPVFVSLSLIHISEPTRP